MSEKGQSKIHEAKNSARSPMRRALFAIAGLTLAAMVLTGCAPSPVHSTYNEVPFDKEALQSAIDAKLPYSQFAPPSDVMKIIKPQEYAALKARHDPLEKLIMDTTSKTLVYSLDGGPQITMYAPESYAFPPQDLLDREIDFIKKDICASGTLYDECQIPQKSTIIINDFGFQDNNPNFVNSQTWGTGSEVGTAINTNQQQLDIYAQADPLATELCQIMHGQQHTISMSDQEKGCNRFGASIYSAQHNLTYSQSLTIVNQDFDAPSGHVEMSPYSENTYITQICGEILHTTCNGEQAPTITPSTSTNNKPTVSSTYTFSNHSFNLPQTNQVAAIAE